MSSDYKSVLYWIVRLSRQQQDGKGISLTYLARHLSCTSQDLEDVIHLLEQEGYVSVTHPSPKITLLHPTIGGFEKVQEWEKQAPAKTRGVKFITLGKVIGASLFAVLLGIVWWWLGINTNQLEPIRTQITPFKIYNQYTDAQGKSFYGALNAALENGEIGNPDGSITATLDGKIVIGFDLESTAENHQINIQFIDVEIVREDVTDTLDLESIMHALGGGEPRDYEIQLASALSLPSGESVIVRAEIVNPSDIEYVYLRPGEREVFRMYLILPRTGRYRLTPIIHYTFQDKSSAQRAGTSLVYFPKKFRYALKDYDEQLNTGTVLQGPVILDTQSKSFTFSVSYAYSRQSCVDLDKWIAFIARLSWGDARLFILDPMTGVMDMLTDHTRDIDILGWDESGTLYFSESFLDYRTYTRGTEVKSWSPDQGLRSFPMNGIPQGLYRLSNYNQQCLDSGLCLDTAQQDTNGDGIITFEDVDQIVLIDSINNRTDRLGFSNRQQSGPVLSPDKSKVLYVEGSGCNPDDPGYLFVLDTNTLAFQQITFYRGEILSPVWSPDGQKVAYGLSSCKDMYSQIHVVDLKTLTEVTITAEVSQDTIFGWSSDSNWLLIGGDQIALVNQNGTCVQPILPVILISRNMEEPFVQGAIQP